MPDTDGNAVACYIRKSKRRGTPIIAITATPRFVEEKAVNFNTVLLAGLFSIGPLIAEHQ